jgi:membrane protease YdiL (CAAX protease family)
MDTFESRRGASSGRLRNMVRSIALAIVFVSPGFLLRLLLNLLMDVEMSVLFASVVNFGLAALGAFVVFPKGIKQPFGAVSLAEYARRLGFYLPAKAWKHVALGVVLALCTLGGMLAGSLLTGRYVLDWHTISLEHLVFSLNPGVWEEFFFRGVVMVVLLQRVRTIRQAALIQILLFGLTHVKGLDVWDWVDVTSVMILGAAFVYMAYKTRTLVAGIVFHFLHDSLLYVVQVPGGEYFGLRENLAFFVALWVMVGVACLVARVAVERLGVRSEAQLYEVGATQVGESVA